MSGVRRAATAMQSIEPAQSEIGGEDNVDTRDIDRLELGKAAESRFTAFNRATTPVIEGKLVRISADSLTEERTGDAYYLVRVQVTQDGMKKLGNRKLHPGMPAEVLINAGDRTMLQYLLKPARNMFAESLIEE